MSVSVFNNNFFLGTSGGIFGKVVDVLCPRKSYSSASEAQKILETEVVSSKQTILLGMSISGFPKICENDFLCYCMTRFHIF